jgi:hypothetical protein
VIMAGWGRALGEGQLLLGCWLAAGWFAVGWSLMVRA